MEETKGIGRSHRGKLEKIGDILEAVTTIHVKTDIQYASNLNSQMLTPILDYLIDHHFIQVKNVKRTKRYYITPDGTYALGLFHKLQNLLFLRSEQGDLLTCQDCLHVREDDPTFCTHHRFFIDPTKEACRFHINEYKLAREFTDYHKVIKE